MGSGQASLAHPKHQSECKDQVSHNDSKNMKSPATSRKHLRVSFKASSADKPASSSNDYTEAPTRNGHHCGQRSSSVSDRTLKSERYSSTNGTRGFNGPTDIRPTHLSHPSIMANNNQYTAIKPSGYLAYGDDTDSHYHRSSASSVGGSSRRSRTRSASPRRTERIVIPSTLRRSDVENLKIALRAAKSAPSGSRKSLVANGDSSHRPRARMTSFVIGRPAKFTPGSYGDMGIFKSISPVNDNLYICGVMALSEEKIKALKINCVINATLEWPPFQIRGLETMRVQVDDVPSANLAPYFDRVANKMNEVISGGGKVLVHCMAGISRSSTLCIAYLMKYKGMSLQQAYSLMKTRRPLIRPNDGFWRQLVQYEKELRRKKSQKAGSSNGSSHQMSLAHHSVDDNPSMTVTRLTNGERFRATSPQKSTQKQALRPSAPVNRHLDERGYSSLMALPTSVSPPRAATTTHKLGTLRNSGASPARLQRQREIAIGALRSGDHWSTTYSNDYAKQFSRR